MARASDPRLPDDFLKEARDLAESGRRDEQWALLQKAVEQHPEDPRLLLTLATVEVGRSDADAARHIREAVAQAGSNKAVLVHGARLLLDMGHVDEAESIVLGVGATIDGDSRLISPLGLITARIAAMRGHGAEAQRTLRLGFEAEPGNPEWGYVLANFLLQEGQPDEALRIVNAALGHDPRNGALLDLRDRIIAARRNQSADG